MSLALEIRQVSSEVALATDRPDLANRLLHIASRVQRMELTMDEIVADMAQAERIENPPRRIPFNTQGIFRYYPELDA